MKSPAQSSFTRIIFLLLGVILSAFLIACSGNRKGESKSYTVEVPGHNSSIRMEVIFQKESIQSINILEHYETSGIADAALRVLPDRIVANQSLMVDTVTSCTITSAAIIEGVKKAIQQAGLDSKNYYREPKVHTSDEVITHRADVIVVGGGLAGLSAAVTVAEQGGSVIVLEKMADVGGNSIRSGGTLNAVDPERQKAQGIVDSVDLYIKHTYENGHKKGNQDLIRILCENAKDARYWISSLGGEWQDKVYLTIGGIWPRSLDAKNNARDTLIDPLLRQLEASGNQVILNCRAYKLLQDERGRVTGVKAYHTLNGTPYVFHANKGVVLATGGFSANSEMVSRYNHKIPENNPTTNHPGATGDGILMGQQVGANLVHMGYIQLHPNPGTNVYFTGMIENSIYINQQGRRFVNEQSDRSEVCNAILEQPGGVVYVIFDSNTINDDFWSTQDGGYQDFVALAAEGKCGYGETLKELADSIGVPRENLKESIEDFNRSVEGLQEDPFGRELFYKKLGDPPFYASIRTARTHNTLGGLEIDAKARVLDTRGRVIPSLVACGEVTGGIHGDNRLGGNALTDCVVFGRIAGTTLIENYEN